MKNNAFSFVVSNGPTVPKDPALRTMIRKQAMRDVAIERRRRGDHGKVNLRQCAPSTFDQDGTSAQHSSSSVSPCPKARSGSTSSSSNETSPGNSTSSTELVHWSSASSVSSSWSWDDLSSVFQSIVPNPCSAYEVVCGKYNVDLQDLSALTGFCLAQPVVTKLADQELLKTVLGHKQYSYLQFVPARYGSNECISAAVDCLLAKLACRTNTPTARMEAQAVSLYAKALNKLQESIGTPGTCQSADTLCAVQLLALYELLDSKRDVAWQQHMSGSSQIIKHRTADQFVSDFDKALFYAHVGPAVMEALDQSKHCYLEAPEWQQLYLSFIEDSTWLTNRSSITVRIRLSETHLPGSLADVQAAVLSRDIFDHAASDRLRQRVHRSHKELLECLDEYKAHLMRTSLLQPPQSEMDLRRELLGNSVEHLCVLKRMLSVLNDGDRQHLEIETQALGVVMHEMQSQTCPRYAWLFAEHEVGLVETLKKTRAAWEEDLSDRSVAEQQEALVRRWTEFYHMLGMW